MQRIPGDTLDINRKKRAQTPSLEIEDRLPTLRICDFEEVRIPFTPEQAMYEASRCIECPDPAACVRACPVNNDIPSAMWLISQGEFLEAAKIYRETSSLPEICGRVCPHDKLCEGSCVQGKHDDPVATGALEAFVIDYERKYGEIDLSVPEPVGQKVAIVGSGPSGLSAAEQLMKRGYQVTIFDSKPQMGGLLLYGIPNFKLDKNVVYDRIEEICQLGLEFVGNTMIGKDKSVDDLLNEGFDAVYLAVGTWVDAPMDIPGENLPGVYKGTEYLIRNNVCDDLFPKDLDPNTITGKKIVVIGGGDTASDCLRTAVRMEADEVTCIYRRTENEMPGSAKDRKLAMEEGASYQFLTQPVKFIANEKGHLSKVECIRMELGEPDASGRRRPVAVEGSNFILEADIAVLALGYWPDETIGKSDPDIETHKWGLIVADENQATSKEGVFAGGDAVTGPQLVVTAMRAGRKAAASIDRYLMQKRGIVLEE
ncbi:MAG: NAD(P)-dependent oxidoreductase [Anaerolineales bacterium]|nr:NAD(P)-dependent oxidoreductase [Anaerolineales bacterium]